MTSSNKNQAGIYFVAVLSMVFWGMSFIWTTIALRHYNPITIIFLRLILSALILFTFLFISGRLQKIRPQDRKLLFLSSLFNPFLYFIGENFGLKLSTPTIAAVIIATIPVFSPIAARITVREKLPFSGYAGIAISFTGIAIMLVNRDLSFNASPMGVALLMFAVFAAVMYSVMLKKLTLSYSPVNIIAYQNLIGIMLFMPLFLLFEFNDFIRVKPSGEAIGAILQLAVFASSLAFIFFTMTIKKLGISRANVFSNLIPAFTALFSYIFIHEMFTPNKIAGISVVIFGVFITQIKKSRNNNSTL